MKSLLQTSIGQPGMSDLLVADPLGAGIFDRLPGKNSPIDKQRTSQPGFHDILRQSVERDRPVAEVAARTHGDIQSKKSHSKEYEKKFSDYLRQKQDIAGSATSAKGRESIASSQNSSQKQITKSPLQPKTSVEIKSSSPKNITLNSYSEIEAVNINQKAPTDQRYMNSIQDMTLEAPEGLRPESLDSVNLDALAGESLQSLFSLPRQNLKQAEIELGSEQALSQLELANFVSTTPDMLQQNISLMPGVPSEFVNVQSLTDGLVGDVEGVGAQGEILAARAKEELFATLESIKGNVDQLQSFDPQQLVQAAVDQAISNSEMTKAFEKIDDAVIKNLVDESSLLANFDNIPEALAQQVVSNQRLNISVEQLLQSGMMPLGQAVSAKVRPDMVRSNIAEPKRTGPTAGEKGNALAHKASTSAGLRGKAESRLDLMEDLLSSRMSGQESSESLAREFSLQDVGFLSAEPVTLSSEHQSIVKDPFAELGREMQQGSMERLEFNPTNVGASMSSLEEQLSANGFVVTTGQLNKSDSLASLQTTTKSNDSMNVIQGVESPILYKDSAEIRNEVLDMKSLETVQAGQGDAPNAIMQPDLAADTSTSQLVADLSRFEDLGQGFGRENLDQQAFSGGSEQQSSHSELLGIKSESSIKPTDEIFAKQVDSTSTNQAPEKSRSESMQSQILHNATMMLKKGGGSMRMDVDSAAMGKIDLAINLANNQLDVRIVSLNDQVRDMIGKELSGLRDGLSQQGISLRTVEVGTSNQFSNNSWSGQGNQGQGQQPSYNDMKQYAESFGRNFKIAASETMSPRRPQMIPSMNPAVVRSSLDSSRIAVRI